MTQQAGQIIDWSKFRLRRFHVLAAAFALLSASLVVSGGQFLSVRDNLFATGVPLGGDYVAFHTAARAAAGGEAAAAYDEARFAEMLHEHGPPKERYGLTWQYPPTYYFLVLPLALFGFAAGYAFWSGLGIVGYFATLRGLGLPPLFLFVILAAPSTTHAFITGQNGFITAALLGAAALYADKRPVLAGVAAAALTIKPQLGVLLPIAFAASGSWRAFIVAALGALALAGASMMAFGAAAWTAFFEGVSGAGDNLAAGLMPLFKMTTPFAALRFAGAPAEAAAAFQLLLTLGAAGAVALVWRRVRDAELRAAALISCVFFAAPYGFYYELIVLAFPMALIVKRAMRSGWLPFEQIAIAIVYAAPLYLPGERLREGASLGFAIVILAALCVFRRIEFEAPATFRFASGRLRAQSG